MGCVNANKGLFRYHKARINLNIRMNEIHAIERKKIIGSKINNEKMSVKNGITNTIK